MRGKHMLPLHSTVSPDAALLTSLTGGQARWAQDLAHLTTMSLTDTRCVLMPVTLPLILITAQHSPKESIPCAPLR